MEFLEMKNTLSPTNFLENTGLDNQQIIETAEEKVGEL